MAQQNPPDPADYKGLNEAVAIFDSKKKHYLTSFLALMLLSFTVVFVLTLVVLCKRKDF